MPSDPVARSIAMAEINEQSAKHGPIHILHVSLIEGSYQASRAFGRTELEIGSGGSPSLHSLITTAIATNTSTCSTKGQFHSKYNKRPTTTKFYRFWPTTTTYSHGN